MLRDKHDGGISPVRLQMLFFGAALIVDYIAKVSLDLHRGSIKALPSSFNILALAGGVSSVLRRHADPARYQAAGPTRWQKS